MSDKFPTNMRGLIKESEDDKSSYTRAWDLCVLFLSGNQWLTYNDSLRQWSMDRPQQSNTRVTVNLLLLGVTKSVCTVHLRQKKRAASG